MHNHALLLNIDGPRLAIAGQVEKNASLGVLIPTCGSGVGARSECLRVTIPKSIHLTHLGESMAYRRSNGKGRRKLEPAVMNLSFTAVGNGTNYIDLSRAASIVNRRFYRQGINWSVAGFTITTAGNTSPGTVTICKVPTTWVAYNAWKKSKAMWDKMNDQVLEDEPSLEARYADFKVFLNEAMSTATVQDNITVPGDGDILLPTDCMYNLPADNGSEWIYSTIQVPEDGGALPPTEKSLHFLGDSVTASVGLIHGYALSRTRPINTGDPSTAGNGGWMTQLFDTGHNLEEIRDDIADDNDRPPYAVGNSQSTGALSEFYPGGANNLPAGEVVGYASFGATPTTGSITSQRSIKGGMFPCGLIEIKSDLVGPTFYDIIVHLVPGNHRGYLCEPMGDA